MTAEIYSRVYGRLVGVEPIKAFRRKRSAEVWVKPASWTHPRGVCSIGFDDVPSSAWRTGGPVLERAGAHATFYLASGTLAAGSGDQQICSKDDVQALHAAGHEVGCHTFQHISALHRPLRTYSRDLDANRDYFLNVLQIPAAEHFAYTYGDAPVSAKKLCASRFKTARGTRWGVNHGRVDLSELLAVGLEAKSKDILHLEAFAAETARTKGWLILYSHDVSASPSAHGCTPETLAQAITIVRDAGLDVLPMSEAFRVGVAAGRVELCDGDHAAR